MRLADIFGRETDYHSPLLRLRDVNRLKKMRARDKLNARKHLDFVAVMYGMSPDDEDGEGAMFHNGPPPPLEPRFSMPDDPIMPHKFGDEPMDHFDDMDDLDDVTDFAKDEIDEIE